MTDNGITRTLENTTQEKDLGVIVDPLLNFEDHINCTVSKGNRIAGLLVRTITNKSPDIMIPLYKALIRSILEYGNSVWCPYLRRHIDEIEGVQRRFTKKIIGMADLSYQERLIKLKLPSLEYRRLRGDLIEVFKILHDFYDPVTTKSLFVRSGTDRTRGHNLKLTKHRTHTRQFQNFFTNRIISAWNSLPEDAVNADSLNTFKNKLDKIFKKDIFSTNLEM